QRRQLRRLQPRDRACPAPLRSRSAALSTGGTDEGHRAFGWHDRNGRRRTPKEDHSMSASDYQRSRQVQQALVQGVDPDQGPARSAGTVLNRVDVARTLLMAIEALEAVKDRKSTRLNS